MSVCKRQGCTSEAPYTWVALCDPCRQEWMDATGKYLRLEEWCKQVPVPPATVAALSPLLTATFARTDGGWTLTATRANGGARLTYETHDLDEAFRVLRTFGGES